MKVPYTVITMIFNNYEPIRDPLIIDENAEYICVTDDKNLKSDIWKIIYEPKYDTNELTGVQKTYMTKYSIFDYVSSESEYIIQLDSSILIKSSLNPIIEYYYENNYDLGMAIHPERNDLIDEYHTWERIRGLNHNFLNLFLDYVKLHPYKDFKLEKSGLLEWTFKIYKNIPIIKNFINDLYDALKEQSNFKDSNDQCMGMYILYKYINKINAKFFRCNLYMDGLYMERYAHNSLTHILQHHRKNYKSIEEFENAELYHKPIKLKSFNDILY